MQETFTKQERLKSSKTISNIFAEGTSFYSFPFRFAWIEIKDDAPYPVQVAFSVPKRKFKSAVKRNLIKRRLREVYRKNKGILYDSLTKNVALVIIYTHKEEPEYTFVEAKIKEAFVRFLEEC